MSSLRSVTLGLAVAMLLTSLAGPAAAQDTPAPPRHLARIDVQGAHRLNAEQIVGLSGVHVGDLLDGAGAEAAGRRLAATGLFASVRFKFEPDGTESNDGLLTLVVSEEPWTVPIVFDNFVGVSDAELRDAVAKVLPTFDDTSPDSADAFATIGHALEGLLAARHMDGEIRQVESEQLGDRAHYHVFRVEGVPLVICALRLPGAAGVPELALAKTLNYLIGTDYSRRVLARAARGDATTFYRERGYLRARFGEATGAFAAPNECKAGVVATIPVTEGRQYRWERADWTGDTAFTPNVLSDALGMKSGAIADGTVFDKGLEAIKRLYGGHGYLEMALTGTPMFDDATGTVRYQMAVTEGPAYRMGALTVTGASDVDAARLAHAWPLAANGVYDVPRIDEFLQKATADRLLPPGKMVTVKATPNKSDLTVAVTLVVH